MIAVFKRGASKLSYASFVFLPVVRPRCVFAGRRKQGGISLEDEVHPRKKGEGEGEIEFLPIQRLLTTQRDARNDKRKRKRKKGKRTRTKEFQGVTKIGDLNDPRTEPLVFIP